MVVAFAGLRHECHAYIMNVTPTPWFVGLHRVSAGE